MCFFRNKNVHTFHIIFQIEDSMLPPYEIEAGFNFDFDTDFIYT